MCHDIIAKTPVAGAAAMEDTKTGWRGIVAALDLLHRREVSGPSGIDVTQKYASPVKIVTE